MDIKVSNLDHLGIVAGIVDEIGLVEEIERQIPRHPQQIVSTVQLVKAMILNGLGFVSAPLYLFEEFFKRKATEHLLGEGIAPDHLNDDRLARALDDLSKTGLSQLFTSIAMLAYRRCGLESKSLHLDTSSISVEGKYEVEPSEESDKSLSAVKITYGYSKDHRPDLKQFLIDIICTGDGDVPLFCRIADGNEADRAIFAELMLEFKQQWQLDSLDVADSALYSKDNIDKLGRLRWLTRVPASLKEASNLMETLEAGKLQESELVGYRIACCRSDYRGIAQRWLVIESENRRQSDLAQLDKRLEKQKLQAQKECRRLFKQDFACAVDAQKAAEQMAHRWKYHVLENIEIKTCPHYAGAGRPTKEQQPQSISYRVVAQLSQDAAAITKAHRRAGRFILATNNVLEHDVYGDDELLREYKGQQSCERGFRFLKDPLFFTASVFVKTPQRVAALTMVMGLCLLVYSLGQRQLRQALAQAQQTIPNQLGKPTATPTLRWVFQCFQAVHLIRFNCQHYISNLHEHRLWILNFLGSSCHKYYFLC